MTLEQIREAVRAELRTRLEARRGAQDALTALRADTTATAEAITTAVAARNQLDEQITALSAREAELTDEIEREAATSTLLARIAPAAGATAVPEQRGLRSATAAGDGVQREARTYSPTTNARDGVSFFADAYRSQFAMDRAAGERLNRHADEVRIDQPEQFERAVTTSSFAGLVVPQYLTDLVAPVLRFGRPLANASQRHQLPDRGMSLIIPRGTTGSTTAVQANQNTAVSNTDIVNADLTVPVVTVAGQQDVARQALERGTMIDAFVYGDLARAHAANVDNQIINGTGAAGQVLGIVNTAGIGAATAFGAAPSITNVGLKVAGQITAVTSAGAGIWAKCLVMHPRRWGWYLGQVDSTGRPVVTANSVANFNAVATVTQPGQISADAGGTDGINGYQFVGMHSSGLPVLTDLNVPITVGTNVEDLIFASDLFEYHLWEEGTGAPTELKFEQTTGGSLTTKLVVYSYIAFTAGRYPAATGKVGGLDTVATQGLVAPSF